MVIATAGAKRIGVEIFLRTCEVFLDTIDLYPSEGN